MFMGHLGGGIWEEAYPSPGAVNPGPGPCSRLKGHKKGSRRTMHGKEPWKKGKLERAMIGLVLALLNGSAWLSNSQGHIEAVIMLMMIRMEPTTGTQHPTPLHKRAKGSQSGTPRPLVTHLWTVELGKPLHWGPRTECIGYSGPIHSSWKRAKMRINL